MYRTIKLVCTPKPSRNDEWAAQVYLAWQLFTFTCGMFGATVALVAVALFLRG